MLVSGSSLRQSIRPSVGLPGVLGVETCSKPFINTLPFMDVELIHWPDEKFRRELNAERHLPRLLLLQPGVTPPLCVDPLEDWVMLPVADEEVRSRVANLMARAETQNGFRVAIDDNGVLRIRSGSAQLTPLQARLAERLLEDLGAVVTRPELIAAGWPAGEASINSLEAQVGRLRRRIAPLDLRIRTVRSRGYVMETIDESEMIALGS